MVGVESSKIAAVRLDQIRPYASLTILECTADQVDHAVESLGAMLRKSGVKVSSPSREIVAEGFDESILSASELNWLLGDGYRFDSFIVRQNKPPSWVLTESFLVDISHRIVVYLMRNRLVGIHTDLDIVRDAIQRWVDTEPFPDFRRVGAGSLNAAFLRGVAKGLWLRGTHVRRPSKPDAKTLSGGSAGEALLPFHDSSFVLGSARAALPSDLGLNFLRGTVGTTPRKSRLWSGPTKSSTDFFMQTREALELLEGVINSRATVDQPFSLLAVEEVSLENVHGAFDISVLEPDDVQISTMASEDLVAAAELLQDAALVVVGNPLSEEFKLRVGPNGTIRGTLSVRPEIVRGRTKFKVGFARDQSSSDPTVMREFVDVLNQHAGDLITVYYESGHTVVNSGVYRRNFEVPPFTKWDFKNFCGFNRMREKPVDPANPARVLSPQEIHDGIGKGFDNSLFSWVVKEYSDGWLTCDDGSGEIADFVHLGSDGKLSLIHVKAASSDSPGRGIAVARYEVVASQAMKNVPYLTLDLLLTRLKSPGVARPATWTDGGRVDDRDEMILMIQARGPKDIIEVVIVQPQVSGALVSILRDPNRTLTVGQRAESLRLKLLDSLLHSARAIVIGGGADDLRVFGSTN